MKNLKAIKLIVLTLFIALAVFACDSQEQTETVKNIEREKTVSNEISDETPKTAGGAEIYKANCARCHGENGDGTDKGISFLKGHALSHTEEDFIKQVTNGEEDEMPAFKDKLTEAEIKAVVKYVREEIQIRADRKEDKSHNH